EGTEWRPRTWTSTGTSRFPGAGSTSSSRATPLSDVLVGHDRSGWPTPPRRSWRHLVGREGLLREWCEHAQEPRPRHQTGMCAFGLPDRRRSGRGRKAVKVTDPKTLDRIARKYAAGGWPAEVRDGALVARYSAPSAGPPPWEVHESGPRRGDRCRLGRAARRHGVAIRPGLSPTDRTGRADANVSSHSTAPH